MPSPLNMVRSVAFSLYLLSTSGCGVETSVVWLRVPPHRMAKRSPAFVDVYSSSPPARPHVEVAIIEVAEQSGSVASLSELFDALRLAAAEQGCDAIHVTGVVNKGPEIMASEFSTDREGVVATCLVYTAEPDPSATRAVAAH